MKKEEFLLSNKKFIGQIKELASSKTVRNALNMSSTDVHRYLEDSLLDMQSRSKTKTVLKGFCMLSVSPKGSLIFKTDGGDKYVTDSDYGYDAALHFYKGESMLIQINQYQSYHGDNIVYAKNGHERRIISNFTVQFELRKFYKLDDIKEYLKDNHEMVIYDTSSVNDDIMILEYYGELNYSTLAKFLDKDFLVLNKSFTSNDNFVTFNQRPEKILISYE